MAIGSNFAIQFDGKARLGGVAMKFSDRRTGPRIRVSFPLRLRFGWNASEEARVTTVDISERGLRVRWYAPLRLGMEVKAILESTPDEVKVYRVLWVRQVAPPRHGFDIGLALIH